MANYAVVKNGVVESMIVWDGQTAFSVEGSELVEATDNARIGGTYDGAFHFIEPAHPEPTEQEVAKQSASEKLKLLGFNDAEVAAIVGAA